MLRAQIGLEVGVACVLGPVGWGALPEMIFEVETRVAFDEQADELIVAGKGSLMQRGGVAVKAGRVVAAGFFAGVEQGAHDFKMAEL